MSAYSITSPIGPRAFTEIKFTPLAPLLTSVLLLGVVTALNVVRRADRLDVTECQLPDIGVVTEYTVRHHDRVEP